jgi:Deacetylase PdaC/Protein of unknown function (DUF3298)
MKFHTFIPRSVLVAVAITAMNSCSPLSKTHTTDNIASQPNATSPPVDTQAGNKSASPTSKGEAYTSGDIKIVAVELKEKNDPLAYDLEISYPQIDSPRRLQERKFNLYVRKLIENYVKDFKSFCLKNRKFPNGKDRDMEYHMGTSYEVLYATPELLSINLTMESYTGYLNSDWYPISLNYDLKEGRPIKDLAELFRPKSNFLEAIASYSIDELMKRGLNCGGGGVGDEGWLRRGAEPKADNYREWSLTRGGVQINFGEYQIGPGCLGLINVVVPYEHLKGMLRQDVEWFRTAST